MLQAYSRLQTYFLDRLERFGQRRYWTLELTLVIFLYAGFVAFPSFDIFSAEFAPAWENMYRHAEHMLEPMAFSPESHEAKMTFRLFFPVLVNLIPLGPGGVLALKFAAGFFAIFLFVRACFLMSGDKVLTILLALALACTHMPRCTFDISGKLDTFAYCFLLLPLAYRRTFTAFAGVFLAAWVDERALIASGLIFLVLMIDGSTHRRQLLAAVLLAWVSYLGLRFYLANTFHLSTPADGIGLSVLKAQLSLVWLGVWSALEGLWLIVLPVFAYWISDKKYLWAFMSAAALGLVLLAGLMVMDISRSVAYAFPAVLLALPVLLQQESIAGLRKIAFLALLISFAYPAYVIGDFDRVIWQLPMPLQLMRMFFLG